MAKRGKTQGPARVLANRPVLRDGLVHIWEAFQRLGTCRNSVGMTGLGPIPWTAIDQYAQRYGYEGFQYDELVHHIEVLDGIYLEHQPSSDTKGKKPPRR